jgi:hypothetical protein
MSMRLLSPMSGTKAGAIAAAAASVILLAGLAAPDAAGAQSPGVAPKADAALSAYAQARSKRRARTRIRVAPAYPYQTEPSIYPLPYDTHYPGPGAVRQCTSWLAQELRPSGPVIVPKMRCWWER